MPLVLPPDLTAAQSALWLDQQLFSGKPIYNTGHFLTIRGPLRFDLFEQALRETIEESPGLQLPPWSRSALDLAILDFRDKDDPVAAAEQWMQKIIRETIPLEDAALTRFALIRVGEDRTIWFQKYHHIITDATSRWLISARTAARYRALRFGEPLAALDAATPRELLDAERRYAASKDYEVDRRYWLNLFADWPGPLIELNRQDTERAKSGWAARIEFKLKRSDFERLKTAARALNSSAARVIVALAYAAFSRLYDRYDLVLGVELAFRSDPRLRQATGYLARALPMPLTLDRATTIADAVRRIDDIRAQNYPHRYYPIQELVRELGITRKGYHGLFDVIVNFVPTPYDFSFENEPVDFTGLKAGFTVPWLVAVVDSGLERDLDVIIDFDPGLVPTDVAARLAAALESLLVRGMDDPACPIASLPVVPETAQAQVLDLAAGETVALPEEATLASLCAAQAERTPDAVALIYGEEQLTYATLHERAARLAQRLAALGVKPGVVVGIALPREPSLVVAVLAVHKAGGAYLALDPWYPAERIRFIVADAAAPIIVTNAELAPVFADSGARLVFDTESEDVETETVKPVPPRPGDLAYVLYTSGSTGRPKAVNIEHRNLVNLISWGRSIVSDAELRGLLFSTSLNFDLSAFEMFLPLAFGGCIVLVENLLALQSVPHRDKVRLVNTGPSLLDALLRTGGLPAGVTTIILAGEKLSRHLANAVFGAAPGSRLLNCYGPTETTVYSSWAPVEPAIRSEPTIGRAIWNTTLYVLDSGLTLVPVGAEGELFIGGAGVARGYLGRPELTAERFLPNPFGPGRIYRTGDRVRWGPDGELDFLGRVDDQMKINGIRIEPGEIEAALLGLPGIAAVAVKLCEDTSGRRLAAFLVPSSQPAPTTDSVRAALERQLPRNMVPAAFVWLAAMPMTPNGKLDRKALPAPRSEDTEVVDNRPPETRLEREIAAIWEEVLEKPPGGVCTEFFDLGGDSLALLSLFAAIEARFDRHLTVDALSGGLTIAGLAQMLTEGKATSAEMDPVVALQPLGHLPPFFCVHGIGGDVLHLHRLAMHMGTERPFFGIRQTPDAPLSDSIGEIAARYVSAMLAHQPTGPFYLGGHSFGATVAYEMARQLVEQGQEIGLLAIIDQRRPGWRLTVRDAMPVLHRILAKVPGRLRDEFAAAPATARPRHMRRTLLRWSRLALGQRLDAVSMFDLNEPKKIRRYEASLQALKSYQPAPLPVPVTLFRASNQLLSHLALDATLGWSGLVEDEVRVRVVPGNHGSITAEPYVQELAKQLSDELDAAQSVPHRIERAAE
jgi:amino acid adenylation domain-containing protein